MAKLEEENQKNNNDANTKSPINTRIVQVKSIYNKHFPTDRKTYNWRIPFIGLVLSFFAFQFVTPLLASGSFVNDSQTILFYCYALLAFGLSYGLYYGLMIGDHKQYTPWILLKIFESIIVGFVVIRVFVLYPFRFYWNHILYGSVIFVLNVSLSYFIIRKSFYRENERRNQSSNNVYIDENIYDNAEDV